MLEPDWSFDPRFRHARKWVSQFSATTMLTIGFVVLGFYWRHSLSPADSWNARPTGEPIWLQERVFVTCLATWGIFWLADCACRKEPGTRVAATGFLFCTFAAGAFMGTVIRE
jgi:hypothetical protein